MSSLFTCDFSRPQDDGGKKLNDVLDSVGLSGVVDQLKDLQLGELLDTPPPGVDEAVAISKVWDGCCGGGMG